MQTSGQFTPRTVGNCRLPGDDDAMWDLVLLSKLRRQGGVTKPTFLTGLPINTRHQGEKTRSHKNDGMTNAHGSYLKINPWPNTSVSSPVPRKEPHFVIDLYASGALIFSGPTITPRSQCTLTPWPII